MLKLGLKPPLILSVGLFLLSSVFGVFAQGYPPTESVQHMTVPDDLKVNLVASEPMIAQPVAIEFDDRGRLWVIQYLQYPNPAGLQRVKVDRYSRTVYDKVPEPPPLGPKGADRITILEDWDTTGKARKSKDFVNGLNLASGLAFGHGGVFVLQVPYLLFYPDRNGDDVPDGDPEVLLSGFGMEDAHSVANSLTWGPDGWLYGCQGSTVTANIRGIEFQQGVWRYHPLTRRFELFCEGGGNSWGLDFDDEGELIYSTNLGPYRMLHGVQGGYYWKSFGKHGALHNPYTYGYFEHVPYQNFTGGHVTVGGIIYQGNSLPERFWGKYIAGDLLGHSVQWHNLERDGSTFKASYGGELLTPHDTWFASSDVTMGPDDAVYVADWYDKRTAHPDPDADWDRSNGRIYRIQGKNAPAAPAIPDWKDLSSAKLVELLANKNDWLVRKARRVLADRHDASVAPQLRKMIFECGDNHLALEALWALYVSGGFNDAIASKLLAHSDAAIRKWTVRLLGDENKVSKGIGKQLIELSRTEADVRVRSQLACTAKRLPAKNGLPIVQEIAARNLDAKDTFIPLLLWWAVERNAVAERDQVLQAFAGPKLWQQPINREVILPRLMQRYAAEGTKAGLQACARLLAGAEDSENKKKMVQALDKGLPSHLGFSFEQVPADLKKDLHTLSLDQRDQASKFSNTTSLRVLARLGDADARSNALQLALNKQAPADSRAAMLEVLGELGDQSSTPNIISIIMGADQESVQVAALTVLQTLPNTGYQKLIEVYPAMKGRVRSKTREVLLSRKEWAMAFLKEIDSGKLKSSEVPLEELPKLPGLNDKGVDDLVRKLWGNITGGTPEEKLAVVRRFNNDLRAASGDPKSGHELFTKTCAICHRLFGEGAQVGPDLTGANRKDRDYLLVNIVDPSAVIRKEFLNYNVETTDGQFLTGLIAEQAADRITLLAANNERTNIPRDKIKSLQESPVSLMPENILNALKPQELRDLFAYLQSDKP